MISLARWLDPIREGSPVQSISRNLQATRNSRSPTSRRRRFETLDGAGGLDVNARMRIDRSEDLQVPSAKWADVDRGFNEMEPRCPYFVRREEEESGTVSGVVSHHTR